MRMKSRKPSARSPVMRLSAKKRTSPGSVAGRSLAILMLLLFCAALLWLGGRGVLALQKTLFAENPHFTIREVEVGSDGRLSRAQILEYAGVESGMNLFKTDPAEIVRRLRRAPVVETVTVTRRLPDRLSIHIKERMAVAQISRGPNDRIPMDLDRHGVVMAPGAPGRNLPRIYGLRTPDPKQRLLPGLTLQDEGVRQALSVLGLCNTSHWGRYIKITGLDVQYDDMLKAELADGTQVLLPRGRPAVLESRLRLLATTVKVAEDQGRKLARVDLRSDVNNAYVTYRNQE